MSGGGIAIAAGFQAAELFGIAAITAYEKSNVNRDFSFAQNNDSPWRPTQWNKPAVYMITVPGAYRQQPAAFTIPGQEASPATNGYTILDTQVTFAPQPNAAPTYLVFDGVSRASHTQRARPTNYPVQTQANFTDHVILEPAHLSLDIIMSDAQQPYAPGQWVGNPSKSVSCFQVLDALRAARVPLTVSTRLKTYYNMVLLDVVVDDTVQTKYGLKARVEFQQVFIATVSTTVEQGTSARQQTTDNTNLGPTNTTPVPSGVTAQNGLPSAATGAPSSAALQSQTGTVNGAGNWSSNSAASLFPFPGS